MISTYLVLNDIQGRWADRPVLDFIVDAFLPEHKEVDGVVLNGDIVDCNEISTFDRSPLDDSTLDEEIQFAESLMARTAKRVKLRLWIGGNHEDRLRRHIWAHRDAFRSLGKRVLDGLAFPEVFRLRDHGFSWQEYGTHRELGKLIVTHGEFVSTHSAYTAKKHFDRYGSSLIHGHTHRTGWYSKTNLNGVHGAWECGCLCRLDPDPRWAGTRHPDWQQAFTMVQVDDRDGWFNVQIVPVLNRKTFFYGKERYTIPGRR